MMAAFPKASVDHTVNLMVREANKAIPEIHAAIAGCKAFSRRVHSTSRESGRSAGTSGMTVVILSKSLTGRLSEMWTPGGTLPSSCSGQSHK
jgi:hypothetical protein